MGGIDPTVITHRMNVNPSFKPIKQKRRSLALERQKVINEEVGELLQPGAISEGTERCLVFMGPRLRQFCGLLLD